MAKKYININVYEASMERISVAFTSFDKVYLSFSGGKDSTVLFHLMAEYCMRNNRRFGVLIVDLEGQYKLTIDHISKMIDQYEDIIDVFWCCLPISLRNAVSVFEPKWICWDKDKKDKWIRKIPSMGIDDESFFDFFYKGMEFEEFVPLFGEWFSRGKSCACFVGIRSDESLNRYRSIASKSKNMFDDKCYTTKITENVFNFYPIYDWTTKDIWIYHSKKKDKLFNPLYELMNKAGVPLSHQRICQPYGDDQRRGLWLFHIIEPETWAMVVARVSGANSGALYVQENGNISGYNKITKPENHTWKSFANLLLNTMPEKIKHHYGNKISLFNKWWEERGYEDGIPDEADIHMEMKRDVPSWRRICKTLLRNDYWCKGLGFSQHKSEAYEKYLRLMNKRRACGQIKSTEMFFDEGAAL